MNRCRSDGCASTFAVDTFPEVCRSQVRRGKEAAKLPEYASPWIDVEQSLPCLSLLAAFGRCPMSLTATAMRADVCVPVALTIEEILQNPRFGGALRDAALKLVAIHDEAPRIVRYVANMQKWLLTQAILALYFEHLTDPSRPGLTAANLVAFLVDNNVASKNTAVAHLGEMRNYGLLLDVAGAGGRRSRPLKVADIAERLIREWFDGHLRTIAGRSAIALALASEIGAAVILRYRLVRAAGNGGGLCPDGIGQQHPSRPDVETAARPCAGNTDTGRPLADQ
jgi:hypothetical protein